MKEQKLRKRMRERGREGENKSEKDHNSSGPATPRLGAALVLNTPSRRDLAQLSVDQLSMQPHQGDPHGTRVTYSQAAEQPGAVASGPLLQLMSERVCQDPNISPCPPPFSFSHFLSFFSSSQAWEFQSDIITMIKTDPINTKSYDEYNSNYRGTNN